MIDKMYKGREYICKIPSVLKRELLGYLEVTDREFQASWFQLTSVIINALIAAKSGMLRQQKHPYLYAGGVGELVSWRCGIGFNIKWKWFLLQSVPQQGDGRRAVMSWSVIEGCSESHSRAAEKAKMILLR